MQRLIVVQQIYARLARLEDDREEARIKNSSDELIQSIDVEMTELRIKLQSVMNSPCPVFQQDGDKCSH